MFIIKSLLVLLKNHNRESTLYQSLSKTRHELVLKRVQRYVPTDIQENPVYSNKIWIFWYQGLEGAPEIVKHCIQSVQKECSDYEVIVLDKENLYDYYTPTKAIQTKLDQGTITLTHFSDILRFHLLNTYGGRWIDATVFMVRNPFTQNEFFTPKLDLDTHDNVSQGRWCSFFIGGENPQLYATMTSFFNAYWEKENMLIDYFLVDYGIESAYRQYPPVKQIIDSVPVNNSHLWDLYHVLNEEISDEQWNALLAQNDIYKCTYRLDPIDSPNTGYQRLMKD